MKHAFLENDHQDQMLRIFENILSGSILDKDIKTAC